ncbi:hypothetical protein LJC74_03515 [Eubacteriales bacterium OttesenSCG-928-A19]|nr:hypothetical protein [Eubacteriales bacterium OttesenSCG-928-A19]
MHNKVKSILAAIMLLAMLVLGVMPAAAEEVTFDYEFTAQGAEDILSNGIGPQANPIVMAASVNLTSSEKISFSLTANKPVNISVTSCTLQVKENGSWKSAGSVPLPGSASSTETYGKSVDVSSLISTGKTYKVTCTFQAGTESVSRSHERTY